jgi:hypothetical protein
VCSPVDSDGLFGAAREPAEKKEPPKPAEPVTGQVALYRMYQVVRSWASDAQVLKMNSIHLLEVPSVPGEAGAWEATFTSASKGRARTYTYSVVESPGNLHQGVFAGQEEDLSAQAQPFLIAAVKVDTDAAYKTALGQSGRLRQEEPALDHLHAAREEQTVPESRLADDLGRVRGNSGLSVFIDASTGEFLETLH